jgi:hypothetical protein
MKAEEWRAIVVTTMVILCAIIIYPYAQGLVPKEPGDNFLGAGILNQEGLAQDYFPLGFNEKPGAIWNIYVSNQMGAVQYLSVRVKLTNSTGQSPDSVYCIPSEGIQLMEERVMVLDGEELLIPLNWTLANYTVYNNTARISSVIINNHSQNVTLVDSGGMFKMIFEIWVYNSVSGDFTFIWSSNNQNRCSWAQLSFDVT